ncbi:major facilitator superfamily domain-containing protein [Pelagophyceae sp. CCMP2097]|nr:major facilitator superfamily domain-containing protein [Pelagophyceae sp. CCMP2097]
MCRPGVEAFGRGEASDLAFEGEGSDAALEGQEPRPGLADRNVRIAYAFTLAAGIARGVWSYSVLSGYLYVLTGGSNFKVGLAEGAQGISQAVVSVLAGYVVDRRRRDSVLRFAALLGNFAVFVFVAIVAVPGMSDGKRFGLVSLALTLFGGYQGVWNTALETIFADSTKSGLARTTATTHKFVVTLASTCIGPLIAIALFIASGDDWSLHSLRLALIVGVSLSGPPALLLLGMRDVDAKGSRRRKPDAATENPLRQHRGASETGVAITPVGAAPVCGAAGVGGAAPVCGAAGVGGAAPVCGADDGAQAGGFGAAVDGFVAGGVPAAAEDAIAPVPRKRRRSAVPYVILLSDVVSGVGSGMTVKFIPLFFKNRVGLTPIETNLIYVASPMIMIAGSYVATKIAARRGRARTCVLFMVLASAGLAAMAVVGGGRDVRAGGFLESLLEPRQGEKWRFRATTVLLYFVTNAQHMVRPLKKAALNDYVPYGERGRWNAVDGVTRFGWSGSAMLGGWLLDRGGYSLNFAVTAAMQLLAALFWCLLFETVDAADVLDVENDDAQNPLRRALLQSPRREDAAEA